MSSNIKLTYFELRGRGEVIRLVLHAAKLPFEDIRFSEKEFFSTVKPTTPFGQLPVLEKDGRKLTQSIAIASYLAKENNLYGSNNLEQFFIDQIQLLREDLLIEEAKALYEERDPAKKEELTKLLIDKVYPRFLSYFNKLIEDNTQSTKYTVGNQLSLADIVIFEGTQSVYQMNPELVKKYPSIMVIRETVENVPGIKEYLASRKIHAI